MDAPTALLDGLLSGAALATQFGAISALLLESSLTAGARVGAAAGMGVATVDTMFAAVAVAAGSAAHTALRGHQLELRAAAAAALAIIAVGACVPRCESGGEVTPGRSPRVPVPASGILRAASTSGSLRSPRSIR